MHNLFVLFLAEKGIVLCKVSMFVKFEEEEVDEKYSKTEVWHFPYVIISVYFTYFEGLAW